VNLPNSIHFIGACGKAVSAIMLALAQQGVKITGSDKENVYGKIKTIFEENSILINYGFNSKNLQHNPDLVVIGTLYSRGNPEVEYVLNENIPYLSIPEFLSIYFLNGNKNILITGSKGKTTTTCMMATILEYAGLEPGYFIGGEPRSSLQRAKLGGKINVFEADDYSTLWWNEIPKSLYYRPSIVILTNSYRDHPEFQKNEEIRIRHFTALIEQIPLNGLLVIVECQNKLDLEIIKKYAKCKIRTVACEVSSDEPFSNYSSNLNGINFTWAEEKFNLSIKGRMNARNAVATAMVAQHLQIPVKETASALINFQGVKGRLEHIVNNDNINIYLDCYSYLPESVQQNFEAIKELYNNKRMIIIYQVHVVDGIPESQDLLLQVLAKWDQVYLCDFESIALIPQSNPNYVINLEKKLRERGTDTDYLGKLHSSAAVIKHTVLKDDVILFVVHPRYEVIAQKMIQEIIQHENFNN
jgi:UDP-N-acetylmuramate: L-alanyl-gamma-D-glutamyl-meso-diaminopimelate ligase